MIDIGPAADISKLPGSLALTVHSATRKVLLLFRNEVNISNPSQHDSIVTRNSICPTLELDPGLVPLHQDSSGAFRIADTRVLLELIVRAFRAGATPEEIVQAYDTLKLRDVYSVVAWCLNNESAVEDYMADRELQASVVQKEIETCVPGERTS